MYATTTNQISQIDYGKEENGACLRTGTEAHGRSPHGCCMRNMADATGEGHGCEHGDDRQDSGRAARIRFAHRSAHRLNGPAED